MASALTDRLSRWSSRCAARPHHEANVQDMLREVRMALLEADVAVAVVREFIARVKDKAPAKRWSLAEPGTGAGGIVHKSWRTMGAGVADLDRLRNRSRYLMAGLQGAARHTTPQAGTT